MWSSDRDMAAIEARLLDEVVWRNRMVWAGEVTVLSNKVLVQAPATALVALGIGAGWIARLGETTVEIEGLEGEEFVVVSLVRATADGERLPVWMVGSTALMQVVTFEHTRRMAHERLLGLLRMEADEAESVLNRSELARAEALGVLHFVYGQSAPGLGVDSVASSKAALYGREFEARVRMLRAVVDGEDGERVIRRSMVRLERE